MALIDTTLPEFFAGVRLILKNVQEQPQIAAALDALGYDAAAMQVLQSLLDTAVSLSDTQIKEYGEQHAATQAFNASFEQADKAYAAHRKLAKIAFKTDAQRQTDLHLNDRKPQLFTPWYEQARHFYTALLADTAAQTQLAKYKITLEALQAAQAEVEQTMTMKTSQEREKGEAQAATQERNVAIAALDEWVADFKVVARIALEDNPQLLEALGLGAIP